MSYLKTSHQTSEKANLTRDAWNNPLGAYSKDREITALLIPEKPSVGKVFEVIVSQAFTRPIAVRQEDDTYQIWSEGGRPWSLRSLAAACNLCVNTIRYALWRLTGLGLVAYVSSRIGTVVRVLNYFRFRRRDPQVGVTSPPTTRRGDTRVAKNETYRIPLNENSIAVQTSVAVSVDEPAKNFRVSDLPSDTRAELAAFNAKNGN